MIDDWGRAFDIEDVEMKATAEWRNGPRTFDAELPDGRVLGHVMPYEGRWLWRLSDDVEWHDPEPVRGGVTRFIDPDGREAAILSLLEAIETRYSASDTDMECDMGEAFTDADIMTGMEDAADARGVTR